MSATHTWKKRLERATSSSRGPTLDLRGRQKSDATFHVFEVSDVESKFWITVDDRRRRGDVFGATASGSSAAAVHSAYPMPRERYQEQASLDRPARPRHRAKADLGRLAGPPGNLDERCVSRGFSRQHRIRVGPGGYCGERRVRRADDQHGPSSQSPDRSDARLDPLPTGGAGQADG